jgi:hypothetical protein
MIECPWADDKTCGLNQSRRRILTAGQDRRESSGTEPRFARSCEGNAYTTHEVPHFVRGSVLFRTSGIARMSECCECEEIPDAMRNMWLGNPALGDSCFSTLGLNFPQIKEASEGPVVLWL